jgi:hypothetical protein
MLAGAVFWGPPREAIAEAAERACSDPAYSQYGPDEGMPELRAALQTKIKEQNGLHGVSVFQPCNDVKNPVLFNQRHCLRDILYFLSRSSV